MYRISFSVHACDRSDKGGCDQNCTKVGKKAKCSCSEPNWTLEKDGRTCKEGKKCLLSGTVIYVHISDSPGHTSSCFFQFIHVRGKTREDVNKSVSVKGRKLFVNVELDLNLLMGNVVLWVSIYNYKR